MFRDVTVALMAFLTLVDLFATQAILPSLAQAYRVSPAAMGLAVNTSTIGTAVAGLLVALAGRRLDRRLGVAASLALLALPTAALAWRTRSRSLRRAAHRARPGDVDRVRIDPVVPGRTLQHASRGRCVRHAAQA